MSEALAFGRPRDAVPCPDPLSAAAVALQAGNPDAALALLAAAAPQRSVDQAAWHALRGMALLARERWREALGSLQLAVASGDTTPATTLNLALAAFRLDRRPGARRTMEALERAYPRWDEPAFRLAEMLRDDGDLGAAEAAYERALTIAPTRTQALLRLATLHIARGAPSRAESLLVRCCGVAPTNWEAWDALGLTLCMLDDRAAARAAFRRAHALTPDHVPVALRLAGTAASLGEAQAEAELVALQAENLAEPLRFATLAARAALLCELGRHGEATQLLEAAVAIAPHSAALATFHAERLLRCGHNAEALEALRRALALDPDSRALRNNLAVALTRSHRYAEALDVLDELGSMEAERLDMLCNRANALVCLGRQEEGVEAARRATKLAGPVPDEGDHDDASCNDRHLAWRTLASAFAYSEGAVDGAALSALLRTVARTAPRRDGEGRPARPSPDEPERRLRVGLLSATLKTHPVGWLTLAGFENLDPDGFELVCIAQREGSDPMQRRFRAVAAEWHPYAETPPRDLAERIRALGLDLLIDLGGYGDHGLLGRCARRLAPVQIKWVGMQNHTTGMKEIDWFITDRWETPPELASLYTERLLTMPDGYVCYSPPVHAPPVAALPALRRGAVTFGCFNNLAKVTPMVIATWSAILRDVPDARLVLKTHQLADAATAGFMRDRFAAHGIAADRLELRGGSGHRELLAEYADIDIVLDPFPYSGGLTTCEALWMGVPVLTWPGETFASRHSASHLCNIGLADWQAGDQGAYRAQAVRRAADPAALARLRAGMRERMRASPLCDAPRFGRNLGQALRRAWSDRQES